ncbi:MAG: DUF2169 domain-containing protein [Deltaproteobacteria bacterium]|nr:DUF2169 domain-containing protein [Deltaproteobacteria bacterium]
MLQLKNRTQFAAAMALFPDAQGVDTLYAVVKATYRMNPSPEPAETQVPVTLSDEYWGDPGASSLRYASEMHLSKPSTDVVLMGQAWVSNDRLVDQLDVTLSVAGRSKVVRALGTRQWRSGGKISPPEPFESMPLVYEFAYGGVYVSPSGEMFAEERNPVGRGFLGGRTEEEWVGQPLPNVEDPRLLLQKPGDVVPPAGFAFVAPSWLPRRAYAGTYDEAWQKGRAPYLPQDFDPRFFNAAPADLVFEPFLSGGESVEILNASPAGTLRFTLPRGGLRMRVTIAGDVQEPPVHLETVLLEPDEARLCLTWRAAVPCDKKALKVEEVVIEANGPEEAP